MTYEIIDRLCEDGLSVYTLKAQGLTNLIEGNILYDKNGSRFRVGCPAYIKYRHVEIPIENDRITLVLKPLDEDDKVCGYVLTDEYGV